MNPSKKNPHNSEQDQGNTAGHEQQILDTASIGILISRISDGTVLYANKAIASLWGVTDIDSVIGTQVRDFYWDAKDRKAILERLRTEGSITNNDLRARRVDGSMTWVSISIRPFNFEGEQALLTEIADISERKRAEKAAFESEEQFRTLYNNATIGLYRTTPEGQILMINPTGLRLLGFDSFEELAQRNLEQAGFEEVDARKKFREKLEREGIIDQESIWTKKDGTPVFVRESSTVSRDENGNVLYYDGSFEDITARKQAEEALRVSEERFRRFTEVTVEGLVFHEQGRIIDANPAALAMFGLSDNNEFIGKNLLEFVQPEAHKLVLQQMQLETVLPYEIQCIRNDGTAFPVETSTRIYKLGDRTIRASSIRDITERKRADQALRENQQLLQLVMDNIPQSVFWKDKNLTYLGVNQSFAEDAGFASPQEIVGRDDFDMPWKEQAELYRADDQRVLESGETKLNYEEPQTGPTGKVTWLRTSKIPMQDVNGNIFAVLGMYEDVTERKQLEQQVQEAFERRGYQVQISTEISQEVAAASELNELFERVVTLTKERLGYYHTQLLRFDATQDAVVLVNGYGETGQKMLADVHQMPLGSGLIGTAAASGETVLRPTLAEDPDWKPNPLLPETKGEIAVPIKWQDTVLGVLDVQSNQAGALTEDDRLLLEGLCGQVAVAMEQTRLRQEMTERLEEVNRLYSSMSHEGWKTYRETEDLPTGFMFDQTGIKPMENITLAHDRFTHIPMKVLGGEVVGSLAVADDPQRPMGPDDLAFLQQVSDQVALALEGARLSAQTQSALSQSERLFEASRLLTQATDLQELVKAVAKNLNIPAVNRLALQAFSYNSAGDMEEMTLVANWWNNTGTAPEPVGARYSADMLKMLPIMVSPTPLFFDDPYKDERVDPITAKIIQSQNIRSAAILPLFLGEQQVGVLMLQAEEQHHFTEEEIRLASALAPQIATVLENRRQFERAQKQAEREGMLNIISQKIQSATTVEAVLQIAARELGHALGAPMTIAQLSMKDKK